MLLASLLGLTLSNLALRLFHRESLYAPDVDSAAFTYWTQSVANAPELGVPIALTTPLQLVRHPETKLYQLLAPPYNEHLRVANLGAALLFNVWLSLFSSSLLSAQIFSNILAILCGLAVATAAVRIVLPDDRSGWLFLAVFALTIFNPFVLRYSASPSWHGTALTAIMVAWTASNGSWHYADWSRPRKAAIWLSLTLALYSVYIIPVIFVGCWGLLDIVGSYLRDRALRWRPVAFWLSLALVCLPAVLYVATDPSSSIRWARHWAFGDVNVAPIAFARALFATSLCLPFLCLLSRRAILQAAPLLAFLAICLLAFMLIMNRPELSRLFLYVVPGIALGAGALWARQWGRPVLLTLAVIAVTVSLWRPAVALRISFPRGSRDAQVAGTFARASDVLGRQDLRFTTLFFEDRDEAVQILCRLNRPLDAVTNVGRYVEAVERGQGSEYLERQYPQLRLFKDQVLISRGKNALLLARVGKAFRLAPATLDADPEWLAIGLSPK